jgi:hypothetical protein
VAFRRAPVAQSGAIPPGLRKASQRPQSSGKEKAAKDKFNFNRENYARGATKPGPLRLG